MTDDILQIYWLRSVKTGRRFPIALLTGDTDMITSGLITLSSTHGLEVLVTRLIEDDCSTRESDAAISVESRISAKLGRSDLRVVPLQRVVKHPHAGTSSFQAFRKSYRPPDLFYRDIYSDGEATVESVETAHDFRNRGGIITYAV